MKHRAEIEAWRATLTANQRHKWNYPATVLRRWKAASNVPKNEKRPSPFAEMRRTLAEQEEEIYRLKREVDRGGGDLWTPQDRAEDIAAVMAGKLTPNKLEDTANAMLAIAKSPKAARVKESAS
jgi:hypothetical protein